MTVTVAEYLGQRTDSPASINPVRVTKTIKPNVQCPFTNSSCGKAKVGNKPICSVRDGNGELWIVCPDRLCSTKKKIPLNEHQTDILHQVAKTIYIPTITPEEVIVKREVSIKIAGGTAYKADYVMSLKAPSPQNAPVILEMQGGGETQQTGLLTKHIDQWETSASPVNSILANPVAKVAAIETNAWRRQQEQFLVKGNVAVQSGGKIVFCVGSKIYDYLIPRLRSTNREDLRNANWTLAILTFQEDTATAARPSVAPRSIPLTIDSSRSFFTNYSSFVQALTNQGGPSSTLFKGEFTDLTGAPFTV